MSLSQCPLKLQAAAGEGVDRHFFGMKMIAIDEKREIPAIYKDAGFTRSTGFTLTSSQVSIKNLFRIK